MEEIKYIHVCSPVFYTDLTHIEPIVRYELQKTSENEEALHLYYMASLKNYWLKAKRTLLEPTDREVQIALDRRSKLFEDFKRSEVPYYSRYYDISFRDTRAFVLSEDMYLEELKTRVSVVEKVFQRLFNVVIEPPLNRIAILEAFYFLSLIFCLDPFILLFDEDMLPIMSRKMLYGDPERRKTELEESNIQRFYISDLQSVYPLCNDTGVFSIGSYLIAYGNGVDLVGIPSQISTFDEQTDCSTEFIVHEMDHFYRMKTFYNWDDSEIIYREQTYSIVRSEHLRILKDDRLDADSKEVLLLGLWFLLHEVSVVFSGNQNSFQNLLTGDLSFLEVCFDTPFYDDFKIEKYLRVIQDYSFKIQDMYPEEFQNVLDYSIEKDDAFVDSMVGVVLIYMYNYYEEY